MRARTYLGILGTLLALVACGDDDVVSAARDAAPADPDAGARPPDAGARDASIVEPRDAGPGAGLDSGACFLGPPCTAPTPCELARIDCTGACRVVGTQPAGTACGTGATCDGMGACNLDPGGTPCATMNVCEEGRVDLSSGTPVCVGIGPRAAGLACRAVFTDCDAIETCDGVSVECPPDTFTPAGTPCAGGTCDGAGACR